jgi:hypothetical protein
MALAKFPSGYMTLLGPEPSSSIVPVTANVTLDLDEEACIFVGQMVTSDGASHTLDNTATMYWSTATTTFANGSTVVRVGVAPVITTEGPPARAAHTGDLIDFSVYADFSGSGTPAITSAAWQTHALTTGTTTIDHGEMVAIAIQMRVRAGADSVLVRALSTETSATGWHSPTTTSYTGAAYANENKIPNALIKFGDGAYGYILGTILSSTAAGTRTFNSGSASVEYGQLYNFPFPMNVHGIYGWADPDADFDVVLYSDPTGTPVAEKTASVDANTTATATGRKFMKMFAAPYSVSANQSIAAIYKPGGSNISVYYRTLGSADDRVAEVGGTTSYGVARASGAFAAENSSKDMYQIGLLVSAFSDGVGGGARIIGG